MSLESDTENIKSQFVNGYKKYLESDDLSELIVNIIIPNFEIFACDLEDLINQINESNDNKNQVIDYIELIFNSKLYDSMLCVLKIQTKYTNQEELIAHSSSYIHYLIILIEFVKWERYQQIKANLSNYDKADEPNESDETDKTDKPTKPSIIFDVLNQATDERSNYCLEKIKSTYNDLVKNYPKFTNCISACENLFETNNLKLF